VPGLGISVRRGGGTPYALAIHPTAGMVLMGSNMAECHPIAFRWVMQAKASGAKLIHIDPRFTRTSAMANIYSPVRAGSDIVYLGALVNYILNSPRWNQELFFRDYVVNYTNAATLIHPDYQGPEDLDGLFSGFDPNTERYNTKTWSYQTEDAQPPVTRENAQTFADMVAARIPGQPKQDHTLQDPHTVLQLLKKHYARYTPELVEQVCGTPRETFIKVAEALLENSGPDKTSAICYAVG